MRMLRRVLKTMSCIAHKIIYHTTYHRESQDHPPPFWFIADDANFVFWEGRWGWWGAIGDILVNDFTVDALISWLYEHEILLKSKVNTVFTSWYRVFFLSSLFPFSLLFFSFSYLFFSLLVFWVGEKRYQRKSWAVCRTFNTVFGKKAQYSTTRLNSYCWCRSQFAVNPLKSLKCASISLQMYVRNRELQCDDAKYKLSLNSDKDIMK